jgi:hypothetical protein
LLPQDEAKLFELVIALMVLGASGDGDGVPGLRFCPDR